MINFHFLMKIKETEKNQQWAEFVVFFEHVYKVDSRYRTYRRYEK